MSDAAREDFLATRRAGIGGTDVSAMFSAKPFGCALRLQYDKLGVAPDFPPKETPAMRLGRHLETFIAEEYTRTTQQVLLPADPVVDERHPWKRASPDRLIQATTDKHLGTWEAKSVPSWWWQKLAGSQKRGESPKEEHLRQLHWTADTACTTWGVLTLMNKESGELLNITQGIDRDFVRQMVEFGAIWWQRHIVERVPEKPLPEIDDRCRVCAWRVTCRGTADLGAMEHPDDRAPIPYQTAELRYATDIYWIAKEARDGAEKEFAAAKDGVKDALATIGPDGERVFEREAVVLEDGTKIYNRTVARTSFDLEALRTAPPVLELGTWDPMKLHQAQELLTTAGFTSHVVTIKGKYERTDPEGGGRPLRLFRPKTK